MTQKATDGAGGLTNTNKSCANSLRTEPRLYV